jgi:SAM-dependent methyltransferase
MNQLMQGFLANLPYGNPYKDFDYVEVPMDLNADPHSETIPVFQQIVDVAQAHLIVEIGSWKGSSAIQWASILKTKSVTNGLVFCIDTWLGTVDNVTAHNDATWGIGKYYQNGYPTLYYQFLANVMHHGLSDYILPFPNTSSIGAQWLKHHQIQADVIYVDGSHDESDVYLDLNSFWDILKPGGVMIGDDWHLGAVGVVCAVNRFARERSLKCQNVGTKWVIQKGSAA